MLNAKQIYQQNSLAAAIDTDNTYFAIDMLDPVSGKYITYKVTPAQLIVLFKCNCVQTIKTQISSAQLLNSHTSPILLVPAPGPGLIIQPLAFLFAYVYGTTTYATAGNLQVINNGGGGNVIYQSTGIITVTNSTVSGGSLEGSTNDGVIADITNQGISLKQQTSNPTTGNGTLTVYTSFTVITA